MLLGFLILLTLKQVDWISGQQMTGNVLGGDYTDINKYPHAVYLNIHSKQCCICGGSILTQNIVLSAAHCFDDYLGRKKDSLTVNYGATALAEMSKTTMRYYRLHDHYNELTLFGDISLIRCNHPIKLGAVVKRVAIMLRPPVAKLAFVSGWGTIDNNHGLPKGIKHAQQEFHTRFTCGRYLSLPMGAFCARPINGKGHPAGGDSGGALVIQKYIQIGIVSYMELGTSLVVYTNVSFHYTWIKENAISTMCAKT